jgi:hypothetical protein
MSALNVNSGFKNNHSVTWPTRKRGIGDLINYVFLPKSRQA